MNPRSVLVLALLSIVIPALAGCQLGYIVRQGFHQIQLLSQRRPVEDVLADPRVSPQIKERIQLVQRARAFGEDQLGLRTTGAYRSYIEIQGDVLAYVVSASPKDRLEPYLWRFPLVGRFPYKGFFRIEEAQAQRDALEEEGYDTHLSGVVAFTALGWFSDPLYASMLRMDEIDLVYTILHEMVHATVFFPDHVDFNEQLATFVGWKGAAAFMDRVHGAASPDAQRANDAIHDEMLVGEFLASAYARMAALYDLPIASDEKIMRRDGAFAEIRTALHRTLSKRRTSRFSALEQLVWNNASLLALWRYRYDTGPLETLYVHLGRDLRGLMATTARWRDRGLDPRTALRATLSGGHAAGSERVMD
jgi:predicted aminopeptidase